MPSSIPIPAGRNSQLLGAASSSQLERMAAQLALRAGKLAASGLSGLFASRFPGRGLEFSELLEYQDGDDAASIDWLASLRSSRLYRKSYHEERELPLILACDCSASLYSQPALLELLRQSAALFAACAALSQDSFSLLFFSEALELALPLGRGQRQLRRVASRLCHFKPRWKGTNLAAFCQLLQRVNKRPSRLFIFSDLRCTGYHGALSRLTAKHQVLVCHLATESIKAELPQNLWLALEDPESQRKSLLQASALHELAPEQNQSRQHEILATGAEYLRLDEHRPLLQQLFNYFRQTAKPPA
ncbi:MAG: DUF58 domain-containing protein [Lentisphaeria bacterium]|nr:DUF58 domain-containing protein [Lentisphaeria bacterium]MDY0176395.1 DUF58 domain-containing protein [Lentisphaeria bacterium]NLZ60924.1 DUF58 domain-containing protein [Lentisphaerota bacterium]